MQNKEYIKYIIDKYLSGEASEKEIEFLDSYYDYFSGDPDVLNELTDEEQNRLEKRIKEKIDRRFGPGRRSVISSRFNILSVAASVAVLIVFFLAGFYIYTGSGKDSSVKLKPEVRQITVISNETENIYLPDGSIVFLKEGSKMIYPGTFDGNTREVLLEGEGYFDVKHDPDRSFIVRTGEVSTKVLGTAFYIRALPDERDIKVTVERGQVKVLSSDKELGILDPDQQISYNKVTKEYNQLQVKGMEKEVEWRPEEYTLNNLSMKEVVEFMMHRWDREIVFDDNEIGRCFISATFDEGDSLDELLTVICTVVNAQYRMGENKIHIYGDGCN